MIRSTLIRIATGTLGLALIALAATGAARTALADGTPTLTPTTPPVFTTPPSGGITVIPGPTMPLPDLVVKFEKVSCGTDQWGTHLLFQMRIINMNDTPAQPTWQTDIRLDGVPVPSSPQFTTVTLWTTILYSYTIHGITPGWHVLTAYTDSTHLVAETNNDNNTTMYRFYCAPSNPTSGGN